MDSPQLECVFCDDIRQEISSKSILIGCYGTHLFTPALPFKIAELCAALKLRIPRGYKVDGDIKLGLYLDDAVVQEISGQFEEMDIRPETFGEVTETIIFIGLSVKEINIEKPSILQAKATINGKQCCGSKLRIMATPPPEPPSSH